MQDLNGFTPSLWLMYFHFLMLGNSDDTYAPTESQTEAMTEAPTEAMTEALTEAPTESQIEAQTESMTESQIEARTDSMTEAQTEALTEAMIKAQTFFHSCKSFFASSNGIGSTENG